MNSGGKKDYGKKFAKRVSEKETLKIKAREESDLNTITWSGMLGIIGWSIIIPMMLGLAAGMWIDKHYPSNYSWTIMLMFGGLGAGCFNAYLWVKNTIEGKKKKSRGNDQS
ncbi:AtpZ/AtpI family protein [Desulfobacterium sp. N47]|uniref:ATP synthase protein I n=1 Tax=uncultured Desulfobacterium sp. TaxID=201089 RepID=E1YLP1_9BACT|nr:hypothetical protein N47_E45360 [uncultured Desulfobacterium sp.]